MVHGYILKLNCIIYCIEYDYVIWRVSTNSRLYNKLTFVVEDPEMEYPNQDVAWNIFGQKFIPLSSLVFYVPVFREYYKMVMEQFLEDNVQYLETRIYVQEVGKLVRYMSTSGMGSFRGYMQLSGAFFK